jgi:hypothetical protein
MLPIDSVADYLEQKYSLSLYYQPEWFKNKDFSASLLNAPKEKILAILKNGCNCSYMLVDSLSVVFVPNDGINNSSAENNVTTIGNPREYEKYTHATINGKILDSKTDEPLAGAYLIIEKTKTTVVTDKSGNFKLSLPVGEYDIILHYIGYEDNYTKIKLIGDGTATFEIIEKSVVLNEVFISAGRTNNIANTKIGVVQINKKEIKELPLLMGETDVIKSATLMPGVQTVGEFGSGFNVRGSGTDQNLILIENVPVFNSYHMFGLTSVLNSDGISDVTLLKASIPAKYGERASSIMDIGMGTMNAEKINITGGIGLIDSHLTVDLPLLKNKINLMVRAYEQFRQFLRSKWPSYNYSG